MKDKQARVDIKELSRRVKRLDDIQLSVVPCTIQFCPKCEHETVQKRYGDFVMYSCTTSGGGVIPGIPLWVCMTCGTKIQCITQTVCKEVKQERAEK